MIVALQTERTIGQVADPNRWAVFLPPDASSGPLATATRTAVFD